MRTIKSRLSEIGSWALVFCALLTTILVVRREFSQNSMADPAAAPQATYVDGWEDALAAGIRLGPADAPVQAVEFADFQCPYCAQFEPTVQAIRDKYPDQVAFTLTHLPLPMHGLAEAAARAAECAHAQGRFEAMRSLLFEKQQEFGAVPWADFAKQVGITDLEQFDVCMKEAQPAEHVEQGKKLAERLGIRATPTIIVNGWRLPGPPSSQDLDRVVKNILAGRPPISDGS